MATQANDEAFLRKYGSYKPAPVNVPITTIRPILGGETPEEEAARRAEEGRKAEEAVYKAAEEERKQAKFGREMQDLTEGQSKALDFYQRARSSQIELERLNLGPDDLIALATQEVLPTNLANRFSDADRRLYRTYLKNFAMATLRRESGAAITPEEITSQISIFFPGAGADAKEIQSLKRQRDLSILGLGSAAGTYGLEQANKNLQQLGYVDAEGNPLDEAGNVLAPIAPSGEVPTPAAEVDIAREGEATLTARDLEARDRFQQAWAGSRGLPFDQAIQQLNDIAAGYNLLPLDAATVEVLRADVNREVNWQPRATGVAAGAEPGQLGAAVSGLLSGYTANLGEEALAQFDPLAAAKLQAAGEYAEEEFPGTTFGAEVLGGVISPLARVGRAGTIGGEALRGAVYGALYGAGEAPPEAGLAERLPGAVTGALAGGATGGLAQRLLGGRVPTTGGPELPPPSGMAPEVPPVGGMPPAGAAPSVPGVSLSEVSPNVRSINVDGQQVGAITFQPTREGVQILRTDVSTPGQGIGTEAYKQFIDENLAQGRSVSSDSILTAEGRALWDRLSREGYDVVQSEAVQEMPAGGITTLTREERLAAPRLETGAKDLSGRQPVFTIRPTQEVVTEAAEMTPQELGDLARTAVGRGPGAARAKSQLATIAQSNPEAVNAAERLGLDLPVDILSDNAQLRSLTGLARSEVGSAAETAWGETSRAVVRRAHEAMDELGAIPDLAQVSDDVRNRLNSAQDALGNQASLLRKDVEQTFSKTDRVSADRARAWLQSRIDDLGGGKEGLAALSPEEKKLWGVVSKGQPTYARLNEARDQIGQALERGTGPWSDSNLRRVKELYGALADDQINFIEDVAGKEVADKQRAANTLFQEMYKNREQMQSVFGRDLSKSLSPLMSRTITTGAKGDIKALNELVSAVPEDMRGTVLASALFNAAKTRAGARGAEETFSFTNFAKIYRDLRANKEVYKQFATAVGPQGDRLLTDLYAISRRMADAESKVLKTGKANQALANSLEAERLINRVVKGAGGRLAAYTVGGLAGGPAGVAAAGGLTEAAQFIGKGMGKNNADKLHNLLSSQDFRNLIEKIGNGEDTRGPTRKLAQSKAMRDYAKAIGFRGGQTALVQFLSGAVGPESAPGQPTPMMPQ